MYDGGFHKMKSVAAASIAYFSASVFSSFIYPTLFVPLTLTYIGGVGEYEICNFIERRLK